MASEPPRAAPRRRLLEEGEQSQLEDLQTPYENFMKIHTQAYAATKEGTILDGEGFKDKAFNSYQKALELIDKALHISYGGGFSNEEVNKVEEIVYKMRMTRKEILERVSDLQYSSVTPESPSYLEGPSNQSSVNFVNVGLTNTVGNRQPPSYADATSGPSSVSSIQGDSVSHGFTSHSSPYGGLASVLDEIAASQSVMPNPLPVNAQEVFCIDNEVQLYFISADGSVSAPSYPSFLRIVVINKEVEPVNPSQPPAFIQCADWIYPLMKNQSPLYKSQDGTYLFPDLTSPIAGSSVGVILPAGFPQEKRALFEDTLLQLVGLLTFPGALVVEDLEGEPILLGPEIEGIAVPVAPKPTPRKLSAKIAEGAEAISKGILYGAEKTSVYLDKGASYLVTRMEPAKTQTVISPEVKSRVKTAKNITGKACQVSGYLVTQLSKGTLMLGRYIAPHIQTGATNLYASATKTDKQKASQNVNQVLEVAGGAFIGFTVVYAGLEEAAKILASSLSNNTVQVVNHKYGTEAGGVVGDVTETVGNTVITGCNARLIGPKAIIKRAAKDTGKAAILKNTHPSPPGPGAGSLG